MMRKEPANYPSRNVLVFIHQIAGSFQFKMDNSMYTYGLCHKLKWV
jgi:hypothetical protein